MTTPDQTHHLHIFGDESSHTGDHQFLVYGTMSCDRARLPKICAELEQAACGNPAELKWSSKHYRERLPGFVDAIFRRRNDHGLRFRCVVVNTRHADHADHATLNNNDPALGLEK